MSATSPSLMNFLTDTIGGGFSVKTAKGNGVSMIYDPATGSYRTSVQTGGTSVVAAGAGQSPVGFFSGLGSTTSSQYAVFAVVAVVIILVISMLGRRL